VAEALEATDKYLNKKRAKVNRVVLSHPELVEGDERRIEKCAMDSDKPNYSKYKIVFAWSP